MATASNFERPGYLIFQDYEDGEYIYRNQVNSLLNYLAGNVIAIWNPNRSYYHDWQNESNNLQIVINWRERWGFPAKAKYGERICYTLNPKIGEVIDLTDSRWKDHKKICWRCNTLDAVKL